MSNSQKTPFASSIQSAIQKGIDDALHGLGQALPCSIVSVNGAIVTVKFDINNEKFTPPQVTCTTVGSKYLRIPLRAGDAGVCVPANSRLGGITGLGLGVAPLVNPSNLGGLIFLPVGNINFDAVDPDAVVLIAPNGAFISTENGNSTITISNDQISLNYGSNFITIQDGGIVMSSGNAGITITGTSFNIFGTFNVNGQPYLGHQHGGVDRGPFETDGVV